MEQSWLPLASLLRACVPKDFSASSESTEPKCAASDSPMMSAMFAQGERTSGQEVRTQNGENTPGMPRNFFGCRFFSPQQAAADH